MLRSINITLDSEYDCQQLFYQYFHVEYRKRGQYEFLFKRGLSLSSLSVKLFRVADQMSRVRKQANVNMYQNML